MRRAHVVMVETEDPPAIVPWGNGGVRIEAGNESVELDAAEATAIYLIVRNNIEHGIVDPLA
jgi:hypothetical protein